MENNVKALFEPLKVGTTVLKNRIVMPPMVTNFANMDGSLSRKHFAYLRNRARGGTGLIITEAASVAWPEGKIAERQLNLADDTAATDLHELADAVHAYGSKIIVQIHHGGFMAVPAYCQGAASVSCSDINGARALTIDEIKELEQKFIHAAEVCQKAGMDGVELHAAHMYLINQFLSPFSNHRTDEYGGSHENRFRMAKEIIEGIREKCGKDFLISIRLGIFDAVENGNKLEDGVIFAKMAEEAGVDMINCSVGMYGVFETETTQWDPEGIWLDYAETIKKTVSVPVAIVGKLRTPSFCAKAIEDGKTDMVVIGRQLICDPNFANKILQGKEDTIRPCLNCLEGCIGQFYFGHNTLKCSINPYIGYEDLYDENAPAKAGVTKKILVVGGGIAGMQFAITASRRGHKVILVDQGEELGGEMILAGKTPFKKDVQNALKWFIDETYRSGAEVRLNTKADIDYIKAENPDVAIIAAGSEFAVPPVEGAAEYAVSGADVLSGKTNIGEGKKVAIIGGGVAGCELAHKLILENNSVLILEMLKELCTVHEFAHRMALVNYLTQNADVATSAKVTKLNKGSIEYTDAEGNNICKEVDCVIYCAGQKKQGDALYCASLEAGIETYRIGDLERASNFRLSTKSAFHLANQI